MTARADALEEEGWSYEADRDHCGRSQWCHSQSEPRLPHDLGGCNAPAHVSPVPSPFEPAGRARASSRYPHFFFRTRGIVSAPPPPVACGGRRRDWMDQAPVTAVRLAAARPLSTRRVAIHPPLVVASSTEIHTSVWCLATGPSGTFSQRIASAPFASVRLAVCDARRQPSVSQA